MSHTNLITSQKLARARQLRAEAARFDELAEQLSARGAVPAVEVGAGPTLAQARDLAAGAPPAGDRALSPLARRAEEVAAELAALPSAGDPDHTARRLRECLTLLAYFRHVAGPRARHGRPVRDVWASTYPTTAHAWRHLDQLLAEGD